MLTKTKTTATRAIITCPFGSTDQSRSCQRLIKAGFATGVNDRLKRARSLSASRGGLVELAGFDLPHR
ncbi:MAG: hypothetical protein AAFO62_11940, partial [Pseudomonadota bacterium]